MFFSRKKRIYGKIVHIRTGITEVKLEVVFPKSTVASLFTGGVELERLHDKTAGLTVDVIDTKREELQKLQREKAEKQREMQRLEREAISKMVNKKVK